MREILVDQRDRIVDDRSVARKQSTRTKIPNAPQRLEVGAQVSPFFRGNHDRSTDSREVAAIEIARRAIEKADMFRRVPRRGNHLEARIATTRGTHAQ